MDLNGAYPVRYHITAGWDLSGLCDLYVDGLSVRYLSVEDISVDYLFVNHVSVDALSDISVDDLSDLSDVSVDDTPGICRWSIRR